MTQRLGIYFGNEQNRLSKEQNSTVYHEAQKQGPFYTNSFTSSSFSFSAKECSLQKNRLSVKSSLFSPSPNQIPNHKFFITIQNITNFSISDPKNSIPSSSSQTHIFNFRFFINFLTSTQPSNFLPKGFLLISLFLLNLPIPHVIFLDQIQRSKV